MGCKPIVANIFPGYCFAISIAFTEVSFCVPTLITAVFASSVRFTTSSLSASNAEKLRCACMSMYCGSIHLLFAREKWGFRSFVFLYQRKDFLGGCGKKGSQQHSNLIELDNHHGNIFLCSHFISLYFFERLAFGNETVKIPNLLPNKISRLFRIQI